MSTPLTQAGAQYERPPKFVPIATSRWFTGLWTNRSPFSDAATTYLIAKFYGGSRYESLIGGLNMEISPRLTPVRRPGLSVYNSNSFPTPIDFYSFRYFQNGSEQITVVVDTADTVYSGTAPGQFQILDKSAGAGNATFLGVGNTLYIGDGVDQVKYLSPSITWAATTSFTQGQWVVNSSGYVQKCAGLAVGVASTAVTSNVLTITTSASVSGVIAPGQSFTLQGLTAAPNFNDLELVAVTASGTSVTVAVTLANYSTLADTGLIAGASSTSGNSGASEPSFSNTPGLAVIDGQIGWVCVMFDLQNTGIAAPTTAPTVANTKSTGSGSSWAASTYYWPSLTIVDSNNNLQLLTTPGETGTGVPTWNVSGTTADNTGGGTAVWTFQGTATRAINTVYAVGALISVTYSIWNPPSGTGENREPGYWDGPYTDTFMATTGGTSGASNTAGLKWGNGTVQDGTVVWTDQGTTITRTGSATSSTNISNSTKVSTDITIVDSNGNNQNIVYGGLSASGTPTWSSTVGGYSIDNQAEWKENGPFSAPGTAPWIYGYAYMNSITGTISSCSPSSTPIILAASSLITVSGSGSPDPQVDTIVIYRTTQGESTLFQLDTLPVPPGVGGVWNYSDPTPDPPNPGAILNNTIEADVFGVNTPPPSGLINQTLHLSCVFGSVGGTVYYSAYPGQSTGVSYEQFLPLNVFPGLPLVTKMWSTTLGLLIQTVSDVYLISGTNTSGSPLTIQKYVEGLGLPTKNAFSLNGTIPYIYTTDGNLISFDPSSGITWVGFPIQDLLKASFVPADSYVTWHSSGADQGLFIADGTGDYYRMSPTSPPESGLLWSPKATVVGGFQCMRSVETSPGVRQLLFGAPANTSGPLLFRDLTNNTDNGSTYPCNIQVGSITLAPDGECAEVAFISTKALAIGSNPTVSVLPGEVSATNGAEFEALTGAINEPPYLVPSLTLYSQRWWLDNTQTTKWMQNLLIQFSWPAEDEANELLTYTIFGAPHQEEFA